MIHIAQQVGAWGQGHFSTLLPALALVSYKDFYAPGMEFGGI